MECGSLRAGEGVWEGGGREDLVITAWLWKV